MTMDFKFVRELFLRTNNESICSFYVIIVL